MEEIFTKGTSNRSIGEINAMYSILDKENDIIRQSIREYVSRILIDTSEEKPLEVLIILDSEDAFGISDLEKPCIISIYQVPSEGWIYLQFEGLNLETDFDTLTTYEQIQVLRYLVERL